MPGASRIRAELDGGPLAGGAPRAVWLTLGAVPGAVSVQSAAQRLISQRRPCHLVWDPLTGDVAQLVSVLRAGRALGAREALDWAPAARRHYPDGVNAEGRVCVQIGVLGQAGEPFTGSALAGVDAIMTWLDSWGVARRWPAGRPGVHRVSPPPVSAAGSVTPADGRSRALWARGGHFGASQVPQCENSGPGAIDIDRITGPHGLPSPAHPRGLPSVRAEALAVPALRPRLGVLPWPRPGELRRGDPGGRRRWNLPLLLVE
jgi:hypothetical protein